MYGTLTIRREIAVPSKFEYGHEQTRFRLVTLANYHGIERSDCAGVIERFCEANNISRIDLHCQWKFAVGL